MRWCNPTRYMGRKKERKREREKERERERDKIIIYFNLR